MTRKTRDAGTFGTAHQLPSGRYRAMYWGPDGRRYTAPTTFVTKSEARAWLSLRQADIIRKAWEPPEAASRPGKLTFAAYAEQWLAYRLVAGRPLKARTRQQYRWLLDERLIPAFGTKPLGSITADEVRAFYDAFGTSTPTVRSHCYGLLRAIMATAASGGKIGANPCVIRGASSAKRVHKIRPASLSELAKLTAAMPERYQAMILLASWCAMRFGELTELRRRDLDLDADKGVGVVHIERAVVRAGEGFEVTTPKSDAGTRDVAIPPRFVPVLQAHLVAHVGPEPDALVFPAHHGGHLAPSTLYRRFYAARDAAGRPDLRFHDLRHTGAVLAAQTPNTTLADVMARLGHSTPAAAMRYQHAARGKDQAIAELLSKLADGV